MNANRIKTFKIQLDTMFNELDQHQSTLEEGSYQYWKIQDFKAAISDLMNLL